MSISFNPQRRRFLKVGLIGSATLAIATCSTISSRRSKKCNDCLWLTADDKNLLLAVIPVMLVGALPEDTIEREKAINEIIAGFDLSVSHFPETVRYEISQLLWLLEFPLTRSLIAGVWSPWKNTNTNTVNELLISWKNSNFDLLRVAYIALHDLITGAWYANPRSWQRINYPGPPKLL